MHPILARFGPFFLYTFTVVMGLGIVAGVGLTAWLERRDGQERPGWIDGLLLALVAGLVGGAGTTAQGLEIESAVGPGM